MQIVYIIKAMFTILCCFPFEGTQKPAIAYSVVLIEKSFDQTLTAILCE